MDVSNRLFIVLFNELHCSTTFFLVANGTAPNTHRLLSQLLPAPVYAQAFPSLLAAQACELRGTAIADRREKDVVVRPTTVPFSRVLQHRLCSLSRV